MTPSRRESGVSGEFSGPWGHKVTLVAYVPGAVEIAELIAEKLEDYASGWHLPNASAGTTIETVITQPKEQTGT